MNEIELWESEIAESARQEEALKEASIYNFYDEGVPVTESMETILEYTQKQLLDPKFLNKMKNNWVKFNSTSAYISTILGIISAGLSVAAGISTGGLGIIGGIAIMPWVGLFVGVELHNAFTSLSAKIYYKHKDKYEKQFKQLKEKAKKAIENDKKNADKYKNILKQIEKIEKDKAEEAKRLENEAKKANLEYTIDRYRDAIDILKGKFQFEDLDLSGDICGGLYILDRYLKIPEKQIYDKMIKGCKVYTAEDLYGKDEAHGMGFKSDTKVIPLSIDDDAIWVVDIAKKNILCIDYKYRHDSYSLYAYAEEYMDDSYDIDEAIEEADKYLGYYKVAECPKAVVPRDLLDDKPVNESVEFIEEGFIRDKLRKWYKKLEKRSVENVLKHRAFYEEKYKNNMPKWMKDAFDEEDRRLAKDNKEAEVKAEKDRIANLKITSEEKSKFASIQKKLKAAVDKEAKALNIEKFVDLDLYSISEKAQKNEYFTIACLALTEDLEDILQSEYDESPEDDELERIVKSFFDKLVPKADAALKNEKNVDYEMIDGRCYYYLDREIPANESVYNF